MSVAAPRPLPARSLAVVGVGHANADGSSRLFAIATCRPGEPVELLPEPENKKDALAVAVMNARGEQMGYLSVERCGFIGARIHEGRELQAVFQAATPWGAWIRVAFDGEEPVLPEVGESPVNATLSTAEQRLVDGWGESEFYPDEVWPED